MSPRGEPKLGKVAASAAKNGINLGVAGASLIGAAALHSWPLLALGGIAYGAMVAWDMVSPSYWKKVSTTAAPAREALPDPASLTDAQTAAAVREIADARSALTRVLTATPAEIVSQLASVFGTVDDLEERAARLARRADEISRYLVSEPEAALARSTEVLEAQARSSQDPEAKSHFDSARAARQEHLRDLAEVRTARERILAQLMRIAATIQRLPAKLVRMRALDAQALDALSGDMNQELDGFTHELSSFEETLMVIAEEERR